MSDENNYFPVSFIKHSDYPSSFIPSGSEIISCFDRSEYCDITVKGFYNHVTGEYHIQEVTYAKNDTPTPI